MNVTRDALLRRVNRQLRKRGQALISRRGILYFMNVDRNVQLAERVNLESFARELRVLDRFEKLAA